MANIERAQHVSGHGAGQGATRTHEGGHGGHQGPGGIGHGEHGAHGAHGPSGRHGRERHEEIGNIYHRPHRHHRKLRLFEELMTDALNQESANKAQGKNITKNPIIFPNKPVTVADINNLASSNNTPQTNIQPQQGIGQNNYRNNDNYGHHEHKKPSFLERLAMMFGMQGAYGPDEMYGPDAMYGPQGGYPPYDRQQFRPGSYGDYIQDDRQDTGISARYNDWAQKAADALDKHQTPEPFNVFKELGPEFQNKFNAAVNSKNTSETKKLYKEGMEKFSNAQFDKYDKDGDNKISKNEFVKKELADYDIDPNDKASIDKAVAAALKTFYMIAGKDKDGKQNEFIDRPRLTALNVYLDNKDGKSDSHIDIRSTEDLASNDPKVLEQVRAGIQKAYNSMYT